MAHTLPTPAPNSNTSRDDLLREVRYRLSYRATLELDLICRAALAHIEGMETAALTTLRDFLLLREGLLMDWLVDGKPVPDEFAMLVAQLKLWLKQTR